ncbi:putative acetyltransferase [Variovorax sp. PBS-H4]|uniref:GNAT family N-acetyltransferase n=1 Tax=Variovorax sp. PBS-H4 TaxID=434008 RepID=UPI001319A850|nr:GNAT family N-acetyltransferase [Variovorax sp. PBS-H4]VTU40870.1 putative acetyltransferase [Variovorax sp. PBS-H4]
MTITITNHPESHRYEAAIEGQLAGYCEYNLLSNAVMFTHTEVLPAYEGQGVGSALARHVLDEARAQGVAVIPACQFIAGYIRKHREYVDLVRPETQRAFHI